MPEHSEARKNAGPPALLPTTLAVDQPLFAPITHPELRHMGRKQVVQFLQDWENYESQVSATRAAGASVQPIPLTA